ncbi:hypothetical protein [Clostridium perfringens]|uniref:hypothetical protein n=1 Tax=Clostridium perfringens TaxID=1502 RepID=UPI001ABBDA3F|nr:hypothetical protein [Clostridium perfringens]
MADKEVLNEKKLMFFQDFTDNVRKIFNDDIVKYNVLSWIIFNTNYSQEYQGLKVRECYFSYSILEEKLNITRYKLQRIMKELINEGFIEWVSKSKSKGESSILKLNFQYGLEYGYQYSSQYGLYIENTSVNDNINTVDNMVNNTDNHTLSKKHISKKQSNNIYSSNDEDNISYFERINKEIDDLENEINNKYDKDLVTKEKEKLINKNLGTLDLLRELKKQLDKSIKRNSNQDIEEIFNYWNSKKIIKHNDLREDIKKAIKKAIKNYSIDEIKQAIDTYSEILKSEYYFTYKWNLKDFLNRNNAISTFMEDGSNKANYEEWKNKNKPKEEPKLKNNTSNFDY